MSDCRQLHTASFVIDEHPPKRCTYSAVWFLHGWFRVKLLPSRRTFCTNIQPRTSLQCHLTESHIRRVHACQFSRNLLCAPCFRQNDRDLLLTCFCGNTGVERILKQQSAHTQMSLETKILPLFLPVIEPATFRLRIRR